MKWLQTLPEAQQDDLTLFAMQKRHDVATAYNKTKSELKSRRQEHMQQARRHREMLQKKAAEEREVLSKIHCIRSVEELERFFADIDDSEGSATSKNNKKLERTGTGQEESNEPKSTYHVHTRKKHTIT